MQNNFICFKLYILHLDFDKFSSEENPDPDLEYVDVGFHGEELLHEEGFQEEEDFGGDEFGGDSGSYGWEIELETNLREDWSFTNTD